MKTSGKNEAQKPENPVPAKAQGPLGTRLSLGKNIFVDERYVLERLVDFQGDTVCAPWSRSFSIVGAGEEAPHLVELEVVAYGIAPAIVLLRVGERLLMNELYIGKFRGAMRIRHLAGSLRDIDGTLEILQDLGVGSAHELPSEPVVQLHLLGHL
jgi:hypothetical protein